MAKKIQGDSTLVTVKSIKGESALVEYVIDGVVYRKYVPANKVIDQFVPDEVLESGIAYGFPWDEIKIEFDMQQFAAEMHNAELWTVEDVLGSPNKITGVLRKIFESNFRKILESAAQEKKAALQREQAKPERMRK